MDSYPILWIDDANQCMRVSSALEAGTVRILRKTCGPIYVTIRWWLPLRSGSISTTCWIIMFHLEERSNRGSVCGFPRLIRQFDSISIDLPPLGRELGSHALEEYTSVKAVHWNFGEKLVWPLWLARRLVTTLLATDASGLFCNQ